MAAGDFRLLANTGLADISLREIHTQFNSSTVKVLQCRTGNI